MNVVILSRDLAVISQIDGAAARGGISAKSVSTEDDALAACADGTVTLVLVDLNFPSLDIAALKQRLNALDPPPGVVAFGPHVHVDRLQAAADVGCTVMSRGQFFNQLDRVLAGH